MVLGSCDLNRLQVVPVVVVPNSKKELEECFC